MNLAERLKTIRKCSNLTQKQFAERVLVNQSYISGIEAGKERPSEVLLKLISLEFNVSYLWLTNGIGNMEIEKNDYDHFERSKESQSYYKPGLKDAFYELDSALNDITAADYFNLKILFENLTSIIKNPTISAAQRSLIIEDISIVLLQTSETLEKYVEMSKKESKPEYKLLEWITKQYLLQPEDNFYITLNNILNLE